MQICINNESGIYQARAPTITDAAKYFPVVTITGPRQSGKTTLIRNLFDRWPYFSLENLDICNFATSDPIAFSYFENSTKRLTKTSKLYFIDTGLACYLLGIESPQQLSRDKKRGDLFENFIVTEALKRRYNLGKESNLFFYRDSNQNEVDLLIRYGERFDAIEIKSAQTFNTDFEKGLKTIDKVFKDRIGRKTIVYAGTFENMADEIELINYKNF